MTRRVIALIGAPGAGKTTFALKVAAEHTGTIKAVVVAISGAIAPTSRR